MPDINVFQAAAAALASQAWPDDRPGPEHSNKLIARLTEEMGELARSVRKHGRVRSGHPGEAPGTREAVLDELGDCLFLLARIAELAGVTLGDAGAVVLAKVQGRIKHTTTPDLLKE